MTTEEEDEVVAVEEDTLAVGMEEVKSLLLGKLLTDKNYNKIALKNVIDNIWNVKGGLNICEMHNSILKFSFGSREDKDRVKENGPWLFDKALFCLSDPAEADSDGQGQFTTAGFWT